MPIAKDIHLLYLDEHLLAVNKPAGLSTLVDGFNPEAPFLVGVLKQTYGAIWVVHRLDKETSGVIVFARTGAAHQALNLQFERRELEKIYHTLVQGQPMWDHHAALLPLRPDGDRRHRTIVDLFGGKAAHTELTVLQRFRDCTLLQAIPRTGRTHQIRAHLAALGYPILGDRLYGAKTSLGIGRLGLHAVSLQFRHPVTAEALTLEAPYPEDFAGYVGVLVNRPNQST